MNISKFLIPFCPRCGERVEDNWEELKHGRLCSNCYREKNRVRASKRYQKHLETDKLSRSKWIKENQDKVREYLKTYLAKPEKRELVIRRVKEYTKTHPEKGRFYARRRGFRERSATSFHFILLSTEMPSHS